MGRILAVVILAGGIAGYGFYSGWFTSATPIIEGQPDPLAVPHDTETAVTKPKMSEESDRLYTRTKLTELSDANKRLQDPVTIHAVFEALNKVDFSPPVPGRILFIGTEVPEGVTQIAGIAPFFQQKFHYAPINQGGREIFKIYWPLAEGDFVREGQMLVQIDPAKAINNLQEKIAKLNAAYAEKDAAEKVDEVAEAFLQTDIKLFTQKIIAERELNQSKLTRIKTLQEKIAKVEAVKQAEIEKRSAEITFADHQIINKINVTYSAIKTIFKNVGDVVKEYEPIMHVYSTYRLLAAGNIEFERDIQIGTKVTIEPILDSTPYRTLRTHAAEITCLAFAQGGRFVSGSEDKEVHVWERDSGQPKAALKHNSAVRSVACSPPGSDVNWCVVGTADGSIIVWDLNTFQTVGRPLEREHSDAVTALAFSPNGNFFASGAADGAIRIYEKTEQSAKAGDASAEASKGLVPKLKYEFNAKHGVGSPHTGVVTALHFTPQCTLVSAARDQTIRVWDLYQEGVDPKRLIQGRSGNVTQLGVATNGRWILRDQGKTLQFIDADSGKTVTTMQNPGDSVPFETLAVFSQGNPNLEEKDQKSMLLTAGASEGRLQLWRAPTIDGKRGFEVRQFATRERSPATAAAFAYPDKDGEIPFAVSGTKDGIVYVWPVPKAADIDNQRIHNLPITQIGAQVDVRQKRIGVEVLNPDGRLSPGRPVTIVIGE